MSLILIKTEARRLRYCSFISSLFFCDTYKWLSMMVLTALVGQLAMNSAIGQSLWSSATSGGAWLTVGNWTPSGVPASTAVAQFGVNPTGAGNVGVNLNTVHNEQVGAIEVLNTRLINLQIGNSSGSFSGTFTFNGATVNSIPDVILRNNSGIQFTLQATQAGTMGVVLGDTTDNKIYIDGTGGIVISSIISGTNRLTLAGSGSGALTLSGVNTYTGNTTITAGHLILTNLASIASSTNIIVGSAATLDVSTLATAFTLASGQKLWADGATASATNLTAASKGLTVGSGGLVFTNFSGTVPPLSVAGAGSIAVSTGNNITVYISHGGTPLGVGDYKLISIGAGNTTAVTGTAPAIVAINGDGLAGGTAASLVITGGELFLHVVSGTPKITIALPGQSAANTGTPSDQLAGAAFPVTLKATTDGTALNASYAGTKTITFSGPTGSPIYPLTVTFSGGIGIANITLTKAESPTLSANDGTILGTPSSSFNVLPSSIDHYVVTAVASQIIGLPFNVTVTAKDIYGNTVTTDSSTSVNLTSGSGNVQFAVSPITLAGGTSIASATDNSLETTTISATDVNSKTGITGNIVINPIPQYRSKQSGNWNDFTTWQVNFGSGFVDASSGQTPTSDIDTIEIRNGHTVTVTAPVTVDQVTVDLGAQITTTAAITLTNGAGTDLDVFGTLNSSVNLILTNSPSIVFESTGKYQHNFASAGSIPAATWSSGSTCEIDNQTTGNSPGGLGQLFYHFIWNCPSQGANVSMGSGLTNVSGNLTIISTGTKEFRLGANTTAAINIGGNWLIQGGTNITSTGTGSPVITLGGNLSISSGSLNLGSGSGTTTVNASGNVSVTGGTLTLGSGTANFNFAKSGTQTFTNGGTIGGAINWNVNAGSTLDIGASTLGGTGTFTVSTAGTLIGNGTISTPAAVTVNGTLAPGTASAFGKLTFASAPVFSGTNFLKIDRNGGSPLSDKIVLSSGALAYGGALTVVNMGAALQAGDSFTNFLAGSYSGSFASTLLPAGYTWDTSLLNTSGVIMVATVAGGLPKIGSPQISGSDITLNATGGTANGPVTLLTSTNLTLPLAQWTIVTSGNFDGSGNYSYTVSGSFSSTTPQRFYVLQTQ